MKTSRFFTILFVLLFVLPVRAETPLVIETAWCVPNHKWLQWSATTGVINFGDRKGFSFDFPEEIQTDKPIYGATITDGNKVGAVMALPLKDSKRLSLGSMEFMFNIKLRMNTVIDNVFSDTAFQMFQRDAYLFLVSSGFTEAGIDTLKLEEYWADMQRRCFCAYTYYNQERILLPTLPPEQEDESDFIKRARVRSANDYQDGQYIGQTESCFLGIGGTEDVRKIVFEEVYVDDLSAPPDKDKPFPFGGFVDPDALGRCAFRYPFGKADFEKTTLIIKGGISVIPPEARGEEGHKRSFVVSCCIESDIEKAKSSLQDNWHIISEEGFVLCYPKQQENRPEEDDLPSNAELDKFNEGLARVVLSLVTSLRQSLASKDWTQPLDVAILFENDLCFFACSSPTGNSFPKVPRQSGTVTWIRTNWVLSEFLPSALFADTSERECNIAAVFGYESDKMYAAFRSEQGEISEELYEMMQQQLEQKIDASKQAVAENMGMPKTILSSAADGMRFRLEQENIERGIRYTGYIAKDSFENVVALAKSFVPIHGISSSVGAGLP